MKPLITTVAASIAFAALAGPLAAQPYRDYDRYGQDRYEQGRWRTSERVQTDERRIESALRNGELRPREAARLRAELRDFARVEARYRSNGLSGWERRDLDQRHDALIADMRDALYSQDYGGGYGWRR